MEIQQSGHAAFDNYYSIYKTSTKMYIMKSKHNFFLKYLLVSIIA